MEEISSAVCEVLSEQLLICQHWQDPVAGKSFSRCSSSSTHIPQELGTELLPRLWISGLIQNHQLQSPDRFLPHRSQTGANFCQM